MDAHNDPYYKHLSKKKDDLIHSDTWDADSLSDLGEDETNDLVDPEQAERREAIRYAIRLYEPWSDENDTTYKEVASVIEKYKKSWVAARVREWRDGEHRDLVEDPTED